MEKPKFKMFYFYIFLLLFSCSGRNKIGDMIIQDNQGLMGYTSKESKWPADSNGETVIEYFIGEAITNYEIDLKTNITKAVNGIEHVVCCLRFKQLKEKPVDLHRREIIWFDLGEEGSGCYSNVGRMTSQPTRINLDPKSTDSQCFAVNQ